MRTAVVSDIHGNLSALDAVIADLRQAAPDLVVHGGDIAHGGPHPAEVHDRIRDLGWPGVLGNTDEVLFRPEALTEFAKATAAMAPLVSPIQELLAWTRAQLGDARIEQLRDWPLLHIAPRWALVHARPGDPWRTPPPAATDAAIAAIYAPLHRALVIYGHIHRPSVRELPGLVVANTGSVGQPLDGDPRASYLLLDESAAGVTATIRRVSYDLAPELAALQASGMPHADWVHRILATACPQMPET